MPNIFIYGVSKKTKTKVLKDLISELKQIAFVKGVRTIAPSDVKVFIQQTVIETQEIVSVIVMKKYNFITEENEKSINDFVNLKIWEKFKKHRVESSLISTNVNCTHEMQFDQK